MNEDELETENYVFEFQVLRWYYPRRAFVVDGIFYDYRHAMHNSRTQLIMDCKNDESANHAEWRYRPNYEVNIDRWLKSRRH